MESNICRQLFLSRIIETVPTEKLDLISSITGFENKSGTVRYEGTTQLEKKNIERSIWLDLGNAYETAEVFVNGKSAGVRIVSHIALS